MSIPLPGTYRIRSVLYPNQLFDLRDEKADPRTPVVGFIHNNWSQNMLWTVQVVDAGNGLVRLINVASGAFVQGSKPDVVGGPSPSMLKIIGRNNVGEYSIRTADGQLACSLPNTTNLTQVTFQQVNENDPTQGWMFFPA